MKLVRGPIEIVVLESPYATFQEPETQEYLMHVLALKIRSYQDVYAPGVLPVDTYDFISTHYIVGERVQGKFKPLMVYRTTLLEDCPKHRIAFPGVFVLRGSGAEHHVRYLEQKLSLWEKKGERVSYASGWTIAPELRADRPFREFLKEIMAMMMVQHKIEDRIDHMVGCGAPGVHTDEYFQSIGFELMTEGGEPLPSFRQASLIGAEAVLIDMQRYNERAWTFAQNHQAYWQARRRIGIVEQPIEKPAAAAVKRAA